MMAGRAMIATATHDTKRGEDARTRLSALSELPDEWARALDDWRDVVKGTLCRIDGEDVPAGRGLRRLRRVTVGRQEGCLCVFS